MPADPHAGPARACLTLNVWTAGGTVVEKLLVASCDVQLARPQPPGMTPGPRGPPHELTKGPCPCALGIPTGDLGAESPETCSQGAGTGAATGQTTREGPRTPSASTASLAPRGQGTVCSLLSGSSSQLLWAAMSWQGTGLLSPGVDRPRVGRGSNGDSVCSYGKRTARCENTGTDRRMVGSVSRGQGGSKGGQAQGPAACGSSASTPPFLRYSSLSLGVPGSLADRQPRCTEPSLRRAASRRTGPIGTDAAQS